MYGNGNEFLPNYVEHIVPLQEKKMILPKKLGVIFLAIFLCIAVLILIFSFNALAPIGAVLFIGVAVLIWYLWRFVSVEFEYTVLQGEMNFDIVYGRRQRKKYYSSPISHVEKFARLDGKELPAADFSKTVFAASTKTNPNTWYAVIREDDGTKTLLYFEMTDKAEKVLRFYNAKAFFGA